MPKPKKCKICKEPFEPERPLQQVCGYKCSYEYAKRQKEKQWKKEKSKNRFKRRDNPEVYHKENKEDLQREINKIARLIDKGCRCIDCHRTHSDPWNGGHLESVGNNSALRWNLHNIFKQTVFCNNHSEGNKGQFKDGIERMYGKAYRDYVESLKTVYKSAELPNVEIPEKVKIARQIVRELEKLDLEYSPDQRIRLRHEVNKRLGIYK